MEEALRAHLLATAAVTALVPAERIVWNQRIGPALPAISLHRITGRPDYHLQGPSGLVDSLVQVDCWGASFASVTAVARAVQAALSAHAGGVISRCFIENLRSSFEKGDGATGASTPTDFHRSSLDVRVWHSDPA